MHFPPRTAGRLCGEPEECLCRWLWFIVRTDFLFTLIHSHLKEKNIYYINTVLDLELVNNIKQSPLSQVGVYTTFFVYVSWILETTQLLLISE